MYLILFNSFISKVPNLMVLFSNQSRPNLIKLNLIYTQLGQKLDLPKFLFTELFRWIIRSRKKDLYATKTALWTTQRSQSRKFKIFQLRVNAEIIKIESFITPST